MYVLLFVFLVSLFVAFIPGVLITLPPNGSRRMILLTHGILFALVWGLLHSTLSAFASRFNYRIGDGMLEAMGSPAARRTSPAGRMAPAQKFLPKNNRMSAMPALGGRFGGKN